MFSDLFRRKFDPLRPEAERLEDVLSACVFGTLAAAGAGDVLAAWLNKAERIAGEGALVPDRLDRLWPWPRLAQAEPDAILRMGPVLVVVEAKLRSDRNDRCARDGDPEGFESDQIRRQWAGVTDGGSLPADPELGRAIRECRPVLVCVVDAARSRRARAELVESARDLPECADLRLLTWQALHAELLRRRRAAEVASHWVEDLLGILDLFGVGGFAGFDVVTVADAAGADELVGLPGWRSRDRAAADPGPRAADRRFRWDALELIGAPESLRCIAPFLLRWATHAQRGDRTT